MRRLLTVLSMALIVLLPVLAVADEASAQSGYVTWTVDHRAKTITVKVKLAIYGPSCGPGDTGPGTNGGCLTSLDRIAREIRADIETVWGTTRNGGYHYRCYRLIFQVDVIVVEGRSSVPEDRVGIRIDRTTQGFRSNVTTTLSSGLRSEYTGTYLSNDPADRLEPSNNIVAPSEFGYPKINMHSYAHEFGHILGLDHYYVESTKELRPGAPKDVMFDANLRTISQETIIRLVERNRDRLRDRQGRQVDLDDLVCDLRYKATLKATDLDYSATNRRDVASGPGCDGTQVTLTNSSSQQSLSVVSRPVVLHVVDAPSVQYLKYSLAAVPDELRDLWGIAEQFLMDPTDTAFALPVTIRVSRANHTPARGERPPPLNTQSDACSKGETGREPPANDCGQRQFDAWMAMIQEGLESLWTGDAPVPLHLRDLGRSPARQDRLYKNCSGPEPWPGSFVDDPETVISKGTLPSKADIERVAREWTTDHKPGRFDIKGGALLRIVRPGTLRDRGYTWTLTLCPMDKDGNTPPLCP
jgi:hypothetical protein